MGLKIAAIIIFTAVFLIFAFIFLHDLIITSKKEKKWGIRRVK